MDAVRAGKTIAAARRGGVDGVARDTADFACRGVAEQLAAVDVADNGNTVAVLLFDPCNVHSCHRFQRVDGVDSALDDHVENGHDVAVGVLDHIGAGLVGVVHGPLEAGENKLFEMLGRHHGRVLVGIVVA